ncbi:MAG: PLP-dependent aminotransferase family protein [Chloroflexota bacterium]
MDVVKATNYDSLLSRRAKLQAPAPRGARSAGAANALAPLYMFGGGFPDPASFPYDALVEATREAFDTEGPDVLGYGHQLGYLGLRELVCEKTKYYEGFEISVDNILVTNGSSHALAMASDLLIDVGDSIITEAPTFSGTLNTFRRYGPQMIGVSTDQEGIRTDEVEERLKELARQGKKAKLIYTIVNFQNPAGMTQSLRRRTELLDLAEKYDTMILEDDAYGELRYSGEAVKSLFGLDPNGRVLRSGTLSKILAAGVRLGWLLAPKDLIPKIAQFKTDGGTNPYMSRVATYYMRHHMHAHVAELREIYHAKRDTMLDHLRAGLGDTAEISRPDGGFFIWIRLPEGTDPGKLADLAAARRVSYVPGQSFYPYVDNGFDHIRLAYSWASLDEIRTGVDLLCEAIKAAR